MINLKNYININEKAKACGASLVAVSKTKPEAAIEMLYEQGHRVFGENRVQELVQKYEALPKDIQWHLIGSLQRNKVKYVAPFISLIHSVDSIRLLHEINKQAKKHNRVIDCLLQFHIAQEMTKSGLSLNEAQELLASTEFSSFENIRITGVMGMATFTDNQTRIQQEFANLKHVFETLNKQFFEKTIYFKELSMGMSGDYELALEQGSTLIRVGSLLFGNR